MWWGVIPLTGVGLIGIAVASWPTTAVRQVRGTEVKTVEDLRRRLPKERVVEGRRVAGVPIPAPLERSHVLVRGSTGGGKSMVLRSLLRQIAARRTVKQWPNDFTSGKKSRAQHWPHKGRKRGPAPTSLPMTASYEQVDNAALGLTRTGTQIRPLLHKAIENPLRTAKQKRRKRPSTALPFSLSRQFVSPS
jgi:hypothetical protein